MSLPPTLPDRLAKIVGPSRVLVRTSQLLAYSSDALPGYTKVPSLAVFPGSRDEVIAVVKALAKDNVPFVPAARVPDFRGAPSPKVSCFWG